MALALNSVQAILRRLPDAPFATRAQSRATLVLTIAHLSDVHLAPLPRPRLRDLSLKRATGFLNWHRSRKFRATTASLERVLADLRTRHPDHIAVTGDLANIGLPAELEAAARWLDGLGPAADVTVVPGNHDAYVHLLRDAGIGRWNAHMTASSGMESLGAGARFPFVRRIGEVALIGLSSAVPRPPLVASGRLGRRQCAALARVLAELGRQGLARVVLIHHPPLPGTAKAWRGLEDAEAFVGVLAEHGAELVLHGHDHQSQYGEAAGPSGRPIPVVGVPSASATGAGHDAPAGYALYRFERRGARFAITLKRRAIDPAGDRLVTIEDRPIP